MDGPKTRLDRRARRQEIEQLTAERWASLPASAQTETQLAGRGGVACGATHGVLERCNFACTSCYLTSFANAVPPLPFEKVRSQLDTMRKTLGPGGKAQITSGEVTLLDVEDLGRIIAYAREIDLDPMVMTNGERFLDEPDYLLKLVRDYGLQKVSIHVDITQRGRKGLEPGMRERDLHPIRDRFAQLIRDVRKQTRTPLHAAHTVTVTEDNFVDVSEIVAWGLQNADAFRMISFQPVADVGRTQDRSEPGQETRDEEALWKKICAPMGREINRDAMRFGHPSCNTTVPYAVVSARSGTRTDLIELIRADSPSDRRTIRQALEVLSPRIDLDQGILRTAWAAAAAAVTHPRFLLSSLNFAVRRTWSERRILARAVGDLARLRKPPRVHPQLMVIHRFMGRQELDTPLGRERLDACVFRVPMDDGRMVSMCEVNATELRATLNQSAVDSDASTTSRPLRRQSYSKNSST